MGFAKTNLLIIAVLVSVLARCHCHKTNSAKRIADWSNERRKEATPRDITIDEKTGEAFIRDGPTGRGHALNGQGGNRHLRANPKGPEGDFEHKVAEQRRMAEQRKLVVANDPVADPGPMHDYYAAVGRLFFKMGESYYSCSATAVNPPAGAPPNNSYLITAAHCVFDETGSGTFATDMLFIPEQDDLGTDAADRDCTNDKHGCWFADFAIVHQAYSDRWWEQDVAVIVIDGNGGSSNSHLSTSTGNGGDDQTIASVLGADGIDLLDVNFNAVNADDNRAVTSLGYPGYTSNDFRYCEDNLSKDGTDNFWIPACTLGGGSSGGPWVVEGGNEVFTVNSYGYSGRDGMGSTNCALTGSNCQCVWNTAATATANTRATETNCSGGGGSGGSGGGSVETTTQEPTTPEPTTPEATAEPTLIDITSCEDDSTWRWTHKKGKKKNCNWVADRPDNNRCGKVGDDQVVARDACQIACSNCPT
jgi:V8-like Glu-specific endopeptidase